MALLELAEVSGKRYSGYVMRREREYFEAVIVVPPTTEEQLWQLYELLHEFEANPDSFVFEAKNHSEVDLLRKPFRLIRQENEPNFSGDVEERRYEVARSINSHASSGIL
jgi:hypothetical protein